MRCKQGGLAWINKSLRLSNMNKVITCGSLIGYFIEGEEYEFMGKTMVAQVTDYIWVIESSSKDIEVLGGHSNIALSPDSWLTPINSIPPEDLLEEDNPYLETVESDDGTGVMA